MYLSDLSRLRNQENKSAHSISILLLCLTFIIIQKKKKKFNKSSLNLKLAIKKNRNIVKKAENTI